jgi:acetyltransferase-like isoleucine patch superfamily enzyme
MSEMVEVSIADHFPPERRGELAASTFVGPKHVLKQTVFTATTKPGQSAAYKIIVSDAGFQGKLHFLLAPGRGTVRVDGKGPMNVTFRLYREVDIHVQQGTTINQARIVCDNADVVVGQNGLWSDEIILQSNDQHGIIDLATRKPINTGRRKTIIADHVWIGRRAMIMPDVEIARESIVAAGACVTSDVERNCIYAGVPARKIRDGISWSRSPTGFSEFELDFLGYRT